MNFVDEQAGERCHRRYKYARPHLARKTSAQDNLTDMLKHSLTWSDPKMSFLEYKLQPRKAENDEFSRRMSWYTVDSADSSIQEHEPSGEEPDYISSEEEENSDEDNCESP